MATNNAINQSSTGFSSLTSAGAVNGRSLVQPAAGFTITNNDGQSGNPTFALSDDLAALEAMASTGIVTRTAANTYAQRLIAGTANFITLTNGDGVSGNPTINISTSFYTTGTFTPRIDGSTSAGSGTYTNQSGFYTIYGRIIWLQAQVIWTAHTGTGNILLANLPFSVTTLTNTTQHLNIDPAVQIGQTFTNPYPYCRLIDASTTGAVGSYSNSTGLFDDQAIAGTGDLTFYGFYHIS